jgi:hypothetical protein
MWIMYNYSTMYKKYIYKKIMTGVEILTSYSILRRPTLFLVDDNSNHTYLLKCKLGDNINHTCLPSVNVMMTIDYLHQDSLDFILISLFEALIHVHVLNNNIERFKC